MTVTDANGEAVRGRINIVDVNNIEFTPLADGGQGKITVTGVPGEQSFLKDVLDLTTRMLIGVRTISVSYSLNGGTVLPGYLPQPALFGAGTYHPEVNMFGRDLGSGFAPVFRSLPDGRTTTLHEEQQETDG